MTPFVYVCAADLFLFSWQWDGNFNVPRDRVQLENLTCFPVRCNSPKDCMLPTWLLALCFSVETFNCPSGPHPEINMIGANDRTQDPKPTNWNSEGNFKATAPTGEKWWASLLIVFLENRDGNSSSILPSTLIQLALFLVEPTGFNQRNKLLYIYPKA